MGLDGEQYTQGVFIHIGKAASRATGGDGPGERVMAGKPAAKFGGGCTADIAAVFAAVERVGSTAHHAICIHSIHPRKCGVHNAVHLKLEIANVQVFKATATGFCATSAVKTT